MLKKKCTPKILLLLAAYLVATTVFAQKTEKVKGSAKMQVEDSHCIGELKAMIVQQAQIDALAKKFGTFVRQGTDLSLTNKNANGETKSTTDFSSLSFSEVKGEWVKTIDKNVKWVLDDRPGEKKLWIQCDIIGKGREIKSAKVAFEAKTLKCDEPEKCETTNFEENDQLYLQFKTPVKGFVNIFMQEGDKVYRLFPYTSMWGDYDNSVPVEADKEYILFSTKYGNYFKGTTLRDIDELVLTTMGRDRIFNRVYILFSEKHFKKPILEQENGIKYLSPADFQKWLSDNKSVDETLQEEVLYINVKK